MPSFYLKTIFKSVDNQTFESSTIESLSLGHKHNKPLIPIIQRLNNPEERNRISKRLIEKKVPIFGDPLEVIPLLQKISTYARRIKLLNKS